LFNRIRNAVIYLFSVSAADKTKDWLHEFIINPIAHFESSLENWHP